MTPPLPPVSSIDEVYPSAICVYCDLCSVEVHGDYAVTMRMSREERLAVARRHVTEKLGWSCTEDADLCPGCKTTAVFAAKQGRAYHVGTHCPAFQAGQRLADVDCGCDGPCGHWLPMPHRPLIFPVDQIKGAWRACRVCKPPRDPYTYGHEPMTHISFGYPSPGHRTTTYSCARCVTTRPDGIQVRVPWPCTSARVLDVAKQVLR